MSFSVRQNQKENTPDSCAIIISVKARAACTLTGKASSSSARNVAWKCLLKTSSDDH